MHGHSRASRPPRPRADANVATGSPITWHRDASRLGALVLGCLLAAGCSITPISEVQPSAPTVTPPPVLALVEPSGTDAAASEDEDTTTRELPARAAQDSLVRTGPSEALFVDTTSARIGVHSAPGYVYTRLGILGPGEGLISTGRTVEVDETPWLEVRWLESTAWVADAGLARSE